MIFRQSAVSHLDRDRVVESWDRMPRDIHPALLGSGRIAFGLDATGLQGLNCGLAQYRDCAAFEHGEFHIEKNLHLYRAEALSQHYARDPWGDNAFSNLPCGWLDYTLELDDQRFDAAALAAAAHDWRREFRPREGILETTFTIGATRITWRAGAQRGGVAADFEFSAVTPQPCRVALTVHCRFTLRDGRPVFRGGWGVPVAEDGLIWARWDGSDETSTARLKHPLALAYAWISAGGGRGALADDSLSLTWKAQGREVGTRLRFACGSSREGTDTVAAVRGTDEALGAVQASWREYFRDAADIGIGSPEKEFLLAMNQYLLRAGLPWDSGLPLGTLWTRKFGAMTFWDSIFATDGMLRAGHVDEVRAFCDWLVRTARPAGRPHMWMTWHDGDTNCRPEEDLAYQSCLAFAGCCIRLYRATHDEADLRQRVLPYLQWVARYLVDEIFRFEDGLGWHLTGIVAGDIGVDLQDASEQTDMLLWSVMTVASYAEFAGKTDGDSALASRCQAIAEWFRQHPIHLRKTDVWYAWIPYLVPAHPFADFSSWWDDSDESMRLLMSPPSDPRMRAHFFGPEADPPARPLIGTYCGMAWFNLSTAAACTLTDNRDLALEFQDGALKYVSGLGYLTESPYELLAGGNSPYVPSSGSYLSSVLGMLVSNRLWDEDTRVGVDMPRFWAYQRIRFQRVRAFNGTEVSGTYDPQHVRVEIAGVRTHRLRLRIPARISGEPIRVTVDAAVVEAAVEDEAVVLPLTAGRHVVEIERDLVRPADVVVVEPFDQGAALCDIVRSAGKRVRWLRDLDGLASVSADAYVVHLSFVNLPANVVRFLEDKVRAGATLITLFHAGVRTYTPELAALTGLNGTVDDVWCFGSRPSGWRVTLPGVPERLQIHTAAKDLQVNPAPDVEVLGTLEHSGVPALTRRRVGAGTVWWLACGNKIMDRSPSLGYGLQLTREVFVYGTTREAYAQLHWLRSPDFARLLTALVNGDGTAAGKRGAGGAG